MNLFALSLVVGLSLASFGVAVWTWWALTSVSESNIEFGRFEARHFETD
jgi:hypothetical protein